jgi:hypothetical protein
MFRKLVIRDDVDERGNAVPDDFEIGNMLDRLIAEFEDCRLGRRAESLDLRIKLADPKEIRDQGIPREWDGLPRPLR